MRGVAIVVLGLPLLAGGPIESFWIPPIGGSFHDPANWDGPVPDETVTAVFDVMPDPPGATGVGFDVGVVTDRLVVRNSWVWLRLFATGKFGTEGLPFDCVNTLPGTPSIVVGEGRGDDALLTVQGGSLASSMIVLGLDPGAAGAIDFRDLPGLIPSLHTQYEMHVGRGGEGTLTIADGVTVENGAASLGVHAGAYGQVDLSGPRSLWHVAGPLEVGNFGSGVVTVSDEADLVSGGALVGEQVESAGVVTIDGAGTTWLIGGPLDVGFMGEGTLAISNGAFVVVDSFVSIGTLPEPGFPPEAGGVGLVTVTGPASTLFAAGELHVGLLWQGTLEVLDGATVISVAGSVGLGPGAAGQAIVRGTGSVWSNAGLLDVRRSLVVADGGLVIAPDVELFGVIGGDGTIQGDVLSDGGTIQPGDPVGTLTIDGDLTGGDVEIELAHGGDGGGDSIAVSGVATLAGDLTVTLVDGFVPSLGDCFPLITAGALEGGFDSITLPELPEPLVWQVDQDGARLGLRVGPFPQSVGMPELLAMLAAWGPCDDPGNCPFDLDGDGIVGQVDLFLLLRGWGEC